MTAIAAQARRTRVGFVFAAGLHCAVLLGAAPAAAGDFSTAALALTAVHIPAPRGAATDRAGEDGWR